MPILRERTDLSIIISKRGVTMKRSSTDEHITAAGIAFNLVVFLPIFLSNLVGIFSETFFTENKLFFPGLLLVDMVMLALYYSNFKDRVTHGEGIYYVVLSLLLSIGLIGMIVSYVLLVI